MEYLRANVRPELFLFFGPSVPHDEHVQAADVAIFRDVINIGNSGGRRVADNFRILKRVSPASVYLTNQRFTACKARAFTGLLPIW